MEKNNLSGMKKAFLFELKNAEEQERDITIEFISLKYNYSMRQLHNIVKCLESNNYIQKIKRGWFIHEFRLTEKGRRII